MKKKKNETSHYYIELKISKRANTIRKNEGKRLKKV